VGLAIAGAIVFLPLFVLGVIDTAYKSYFPDSGDGNVIWFLVFATFFCGTGIVSCFWLALGRKSALVIALLLLGFMLFILALLGTSAYLR